MPKKKTCAFLICLYFIRNQIPGYFWRFTISRNTRTPETLSKLCCQLTERNVINAQIF